MAKWIIKYKTKAGGWKYVKCLHSRNVAAEVFPSCRQSTGALRKRVAEGLIEDALTDETGFTRSIASRID